MSELLREIGSIALFRGVRDKEPLKSLSEFLLKMGPGYSMEDMIDSYGNFCSVLYELRPDCDLSAAIWDALVDDMNPYLRFRIDSLTDPEQVTRASTLLNLTAERELDLLTRIGNYTSYDFKNEMIYDGYLPDFRSSHIDFKKRYMNMMDHLTSKGYGIYAKYDFFMIRGGELVPVTHPDPISVDDLYCYELQRNKVIDNTSAFCDGKAFSDVLLYGDAGTGKSSTVKSAARLFFDKGVRLVQVPKSELETLQDTIDLLSEVPLKFIIFIDDISFEADDDRISGLKSVIEGAAAGGRKNVVIYATSNRRHMIKETFSSRQNEMHVTDTIAEQMSLSERFGLRILYEKPNKETYLTIVRNLAKARGVKLPEEQLVASAEQFAIRGGGRSARIARQFVESL
ncbi:MAG: DUF815 domain-containing protein [Clostridiales bacterium]|nr:DUF815 domain-containing protein [Clostridiales bacterium]